MVLQLLRLSWSAADAGSQHDERDDARYRQVRAEKIPASLRSFTAPVATSLGKSRFLCSGHGVVLGDAGRAFSPKSNLRFMALVYLLLLLPVYPTPS